MHNDSNDSDYRSKYQITLNVYNQHITLFLYGTKLSNGFGKAKSIDEKNIYSITKLPQT